MSPCLGDVCVSGAWLQVWWHCCQQGPLGAVAVPHSAGKAPCHWTCTGRDAEQTRCRQGDVALEGDAARAEGL
eukprot:365809-Chlamydomonas_euryale.AAC.5